MAHKKSRLKLKPAGYVALAVAALLALALILAACNYVDQQFIHPFGDGIPTSLAATFTPTPQVGVTKPAQPAATSELDALPPLATATRLSSSKSTLPGASLKATPLPPPAATDARAAGIPWAGKVAPGKPVPDEVVKSITANWDEMYKTLYDYQNVKVNGKPGDKAWWTQQIKRFFTGATVDDRLQSVEGWFKPGAMGGPGFIESGIYTLNVKSCSSDAECVLEINVQSGQWWACSVADQQFSRANAVKPFQWRSVMQYDTASARWKFKEVE